MDNLMLLLDGFHTVLTLQNVLVVAIGAILGLVVGAMPGIGSLAGVALLLPLTYKFNPTTAIIMLGSLYYANMYGGSFSAILLNIPGDNPAVMTALDGYPMATQKGRPGQALFTANLSSFIGGTIGMLILTFIGPQLANVGLKFGPAEMTAILLIAMTSISWLVGENPTKGIMITMLGILIACVGMDTLSGSPRYEFGNMWLLGGIPFTPFVIGTVGFSQVMKLMKDRYKVVESEFMNKRLTIKGSMLTRSDVKRLLPPALRSGFLGTFVGVLPGAGATTGAFMGYGVQKAFKNKEPLGTGALEGVAACEAANNAAAAGAFAPLLALGIPGSGTGAVLLGGLLMWGLTPGPLLFQNESEFAWGLIASLFVANIITLAIALMVIPFLIKILTVKVKYMIPCITVICIVGSYSTSNSMYGVLVMFFAGILGYLLYKNEYPTAPMLLAFVLSPLLESSMRKTFIISGGSVSIFFEKPISLVLLICLAAIVATPIVRSIIKWVRQANHKKIHMS
ncbi:tripartite tricarboxylate transporter permease [Fusibacter paucivorans]|uniref:Tripartite tricarboxylate transporter permease n=1 Tax=Fusibacter paucivorans TaxID=76009 RepID=A0ABS5PMF4_9FIRM|nr:tripartite tricarboxylate transporter permease [Fusibacter paucivorans]MBS7526358.1 tripartite tricarboxylate transporter permease [Fusibacter paucivorans]